MMPWPFLKNRGLSDLENQGLIQSFEFSFELAWKVIADYFLDQGNPTIRGSRDAFRDAFKFELIKNGELWMDMILSRNLSSHTNNHKLAEAISKKIINGYTTAFNQFLAIMNTFKDE